MISIDNCFLKNMMKNNLINIAYGKPCRQSSLSKWSKSYKANGVTQDLIDEETFGFHTDIENNFPYLIIDLLWIYPIDSIVVYNRIEDKFLDNARSLSVEVSEDNKNWTTIHTGRTYFSYTVPLMLPLLSKISARYIRFSLKEKVYFHLYKIEVFTERSTLSKVESYDYKVCNESFNSKSSIQSVILGTSNSLLYMGYSYALTYNKLELIQNISLGSSHATMIPYRLNLIKNVHVDILILDISINEQRAFSKNLYNLTLLEELFKMFITYCSKHNITPIVLLMPNLNCINTNNKLKTDPRSYKIKKIYFHLCEKYSVSFFDGYEFLDQLSLKLGRTKKSFFKDTLHLNKFSAQILGHNLSSSIQKSHQELKKSEKVERVSCKFYFLSIQPYASKIIERKTSLMTVSLAQLRENDFMKIKVPSGHVLVGFIINMYRSYASIKISTGEKSIIKRLDSDQYSDKRNLALVSWSLVNPITIENNYLSLEVIPSGDDKNYEPNDHCQQALIPTNDCTLEIEGLILKSNEQIKSSTTCSIYKNLTTVELSF